MISHFDHIVLTVANIDRAVSFYEMVLKMEPITFGKGRKGLRFGQQKINLQLLGEELRNHAMEGAGDLCLITDWSMDDVMEHLNTCNVAILEGPVMKSGAQGPIQSVYINDPDNNLIEIGVYSQEPDSQDIEDVDLKELGSELGPTEEIESVAAKTQTIESTETKNSNEDAVSENQDAPNIDNTDSSSKSK